jgi:hypothetical protein
MSGITRRIGKGAGMAAVTVALLAAGAPAASAALPYGAAHANCYPDGTISTTSNMNKIGLGAQWLGWNIHYYDRRQGRVTFTSGWRTFWSGYGMLASPAKLSLRVDQGHYFVYTEYGWNLGSGWITAGSWAGSYLTAGDFFGVPEGFCRAAPILQTVTGCADFGLATVACASRAPASNRRSGRAVSTPKSLQAIARLQRSTAVQRVMRRAVPAPPDHTRPAG